MAADLSAGYTPSPVSIPSMILTWLIPFMLVAMPPGLHAQKSDTTILADLEQMISESYGPDQHLVNGIEYINLHIRTTGHKFLDEDEFYKGRVVIDGKDYKDVFLKYDIFNQQVLLLIDHHLGGNKQLILNNLRIDEFEINGRIFHKYTFPNSGTLFYQVIGNKKMACLYHFKKQEIPRAIDQYSNRSFIRIFPDRQSEIKSFIRLHKFQVKKLNDAQMQQLIIYCNSLTQNPIEDQ
jgi:hypothetical protein